MQSKQLGGRRSMGKAERMAETEIKVGLSVKDLIVALKELSAEDREFFIENLLAATNPEYLESIREARQDYKARRIVTDAELPKS
jgi:hypothetical protein